MLKYYDFSGVSFLVEKSFECENASENAAARFDPAVRLYTVPGYCTVLMSDADTVLFYRGVTFLDSTNPPGN